jgi:HNH endonuclease
MDRHTKSNGQGQGMNWIRQEKRLAIYLRDGLACAYCGEGIEQGAQLTLDHVIPHSHGGSNDAVNIVTACHKCNSARGARGIEAFAATVAAYLNHGIVAADILAHIQTTIQRPLDVKAAKALIAARGSWTAAIRIGKE